METRDATESDSARIRDIAEQSFQASYALSPLDIETIIEAEFEDEAIAARLDDDKNILLVAERDGSSSALRRPGSRPTSAARSSGSTSIRPSGGKGPEQISPSGLSPNCESA